MAWSEWKKFGGKPEYLGEGISFDIKPYYENYTTLTIDNFIVEPINREYVEAKITGSASQPDKGAEVTMTLVKEYDNQTGILTAYVNIYCVAVSSGSASNWGWAAVATNNKKSNVKCYLVP